MIRPNSPNTKPSTPQPKKAFHETTKGRLIIFSVVALFISSIVTFNMVSLRASTNTNCEAFNTGSINDYASLNVTFTCTQPTQTVYFSVCDSGSVANDDLFNMSFNNSVVSSNRYDNNRELVTVGSMSVNSGSHSVIVQSISAGGDPPATYGYAVSPSYSAVVNFL